MTSSSKFVKVDTKSGIIITLINNVDGLIIYVVQLKMKLSLSA